MTAAQEVSLTPAPGTGRWKARGGSGRRRSARVRTLRWGLLCAVTGLLLSLTAGRAASDQAGAGDRDGPGSRSAQTVGRDRVWPVTGGAGGARPVVERDWEPPPRDWAAGHRGVDLTVRRGRPVRAVADGRVSFSGKVAGRGVVSVELSGTGDPPIRTTYEPVRPSVHEGDEVRAGQRIATVSDGPFHCAGACLHWGARRGERYLDPLSLLPDALLRSGPSRLLPVFGVPVPESAPRSRTGSPSGRRPGDAAPVEATTAAARAGTAQSDAGYGPVSGTGVSAGGAGLTVALTGASLLARRRLARPGMSPRGPP